METFNRSFVGTFKHLSLWEVAHRWVGIDPEVSDEKKLPVQVRDILKVLLKAQVDSELWVARTNGHVLKDYTYIDSKDFVPNPDKKWDGSSEHKQLLYVEHMEKVLIPHDEFIHKHYKILYDGSPYECEYLESIHVDRENLAEWATSSEYPFPSFWFSQDEEEAFYKNFADGGFSLIGSIKKYINQSKNEEELTDSDYIGEAEELGKVKNSKQALKQEDIDLLWKRLQPKQKNRLLCRELADVLWTQNNEYKIIDVVKSSIIQEFGGGKYFGEKTISNWIKDIDPRPQASKTGPKS